MTRGATRSLYESTDRPEPARLPPMLAEAAIRLKSLPSPISRSVVSTVAASALLLQALFAMPLALRMTADAIHWVQFSGSICAATADDGPLENDHQPIHQFPTHNHAQCLICQGYALPLGLPAVVLCVLMALFSQVSTRRPEGTGSPWQRDPYHSYHSRAPPVAV